MMVISNMQTMLEGKAQGLFRAQSSWFCFGNGSCGRIEGLFPKCIGPRYFLMRRNKIYVPGGGDFGSGLYIYGMDVLGSCRLINRALVTKYLYYSYCYYYYY